MTTCIVCGCTDLNACVVEGEACRWTEMEPGVIEINGGGICSFCAVTEILSGSEEQAEPFGQFFDETMQALQRGFDKPSDDEREEPLVELVTDYEADLYLRARRRL